MSLPVRLAVLLAVLVSGCASIGSLKEAEGQGARRVYPYAIEAVHEATLAGATRQGLEILESDSSFVVLSYGITWLGWGGRIAVFLRPIAANATEVEVLNRPVLARVAYAPDGQSTLLDELDHQLRRSK